MRQQTNQTKAQAIEAAREMGGFVWRSGKYYWASHVAPHPDSVIVWPEITAPHTLDGYRAAHQITKRGIEAGLAEMRKKPTEDR